MKKYRFIAIQQVNGETFDNHPVYRVTNNKSGDQLATISYYYPWKQYIFTSREECVFNNSCLRDILDFMEKHAGKETVKA